LGWRLKKSITLPGCGYNRGDKPEKVNVPEKNGGVFKTGGGTGEKDGKK